MNDPRKAIFLSYASQDAVAAQRIAEALRAAGVEVWFDQNELVGGDQWDSKIRGQIGSCALFVPVISAATQARREGYFRLEWKLAAQRTHMMSERTTFLLPVIIDATRDAEADVPGEFKAVQWTRLPQGEAPPAFVSRVKKLLGGEPRAAVPAHATPVAGIPLRRGTPLYRTVGFWAGLAICGVLVAYRVWRPTEKPPAATPPVPGDVAASELSRVRAALIPDRWQREDFATVSATLDRLIQDNPESADAWAMRSIINSLQVLRNFDSSTRPLEVGKMAADRALRLNPGSPLGELAFGMHLVAMMSRGGDAQACRSHIDRGLAGIPPDPLTRYAELVSRWFAFDFAEVNRIAEAWLKAEPGSSFPAWIYAQSYMVRRQAAEAARWAEQASVDPNITGVRALFTLFESHYYLNADVAAARAGLDRISSTGRSVHRVVHARWLLDVAEHKWDAALQELAQVPENFLFDRTYHGPKSLLAGLAHRGAGRPEAAQAQFREAERLLREHLAQDADNEELHAVLAVTLACAGRAAEARAELALVEPLLKGRPPTLYRGPLVVPIAQAYSELGEFGTAASWLRKLFSEPSQFPFTPASIRLDPRFAGAVDAPEIQALLKEFVALDVPALPAPSSLLPAPAQTAADQKSVAVLAFANLSDDKANEYFSDGISEELLNVLAKVPGLKVTARTSSFHFKGKDTPIPEIARQLGVAYVVEGSVRKAGDKVRITAQLIKAADGFHVWSDTFTRDLKDIFAVQDEIAGLVAKNLQLRLGESARPVGPVNPEAHQLYLRARAEWRRRSAEAFDRADVLLQQALALDPEFAPAYAVLAYVWLVRDDTAPNFDAHGKPTPQVEMALAYANRALQLDADSADAHVAHAGAQVMLRQWPEAEREFRRAIELNPNHATAHQWLARLLEVEGRMDEAIAEIRRATELDPLASRIFDNLAMILIHAGQISGAREAIERAVLLQPDNRQALAIKAEILIRVGHLEEARPLVEDVVNRLLTSTPVDSTSGHVCRLMGGLGDPVRAAAAYERIPESGMVPKVMAALKIGRKEEALTRLDPAGLTFWWTNELLWSDTLDPIRQTARFSEFLSQAGLVEANGRVQAWRAAHPTKEAPVK